MFFRSRTRIVDPSLPLRMTWPEEKAMFFRSRTRIVDPSLPLRMTWPGQFASFPTGEFCGDDANGQAVLLSHRLRVPAHALQELFVLLRIGGQRSID